MSPAPDLSGAMLPENQMDTNATNAALALTLANARNGTFTGLITQKIGEERGAKGSKVRYGDDLVHVVLYTGFRYENLVVRSRELLQAMNPADLVTEFATKGIAAGDGSAIRLADVCKAVADLDESFKASLDGTAVSTVEHVYEPLVVDGQVVRGAKVYKCVAAEGIPCHCRNCTGDQKAPVPGQINLSGLKIGEKVIEAAVNGPVPYAKSRADVVAKNIIRSRLPVGKYVSYRLEPGADFILRAGGTAAIAADKDGVTFDAAKVAAAADLLVSKAA